MGERAKAVTGCVCCTIGSTVPADSAVNLVLSTGQVTVPRVVNLPREEAVALLEDPARALVPQIREEEKAKKLKEMMDARLRGEPEAE